MKLRTLSSLLIRPTFKILLVGISLISAFGATHDKAAAQPPCNTVNPQADFMTNFNTPCFALPLNSSNGLSASGDANAIYDSIQFLVTPGYELILVGTFPNSRFLGATVYDEHLAITSTMNDYSILPLNSTMVNPFLTGVQYQPNQQYGITVGFGTPMTTTPTAGCSTSDTTIDSNFLDASQIHAGLTWNGYSGIGSPPYNFPSHISGANAAGLLLVRKYVNPFGSQVESVIVRKTSNGCAVPVNQMKGVVLFPAQGLTWTSFDQSQISYHQKFSNGIEQLQCYQPDPNAAKQWFRSVDYVPIATLGAALDADLTTTNLTPLFSGQNFIRLRFPVPTTPNIPCAPGTSCSLTGNEDLRYYSISFMGGSKGYGLVTLASLDDTSFVPDPDGNVTLLVNLGTGVTPPSFVTTANYYNYFDLTQVPNYTNVSRIELRTMLPNGAFNCSAANVPLFTMEYFNINHTQPGGFMGQFVPTIDFPTASSLTNPPIEPPARTNTCSYVPGPPSPCGPVDAFIFPQQ
jgi:hypothetical protein